MPIQFDNYDQQKIDRLKNHLTLMAEKRNPKFYEIFVDTLKAVQKTDEPKEFEGYEDYMTPDTEQIKIVIYDSGASPRNTQYVFVMKARSREEAVDLSLGSLPNQTFSMSSLNAMRKTLDKKNEQTVEIQALKRTITELRKELADAEAYSDQLASAVEEAKANGNKIGGIHWGDVFSVALEGMVRRNTHIIAQIPGVSGLAGIIEKDNSKSPVPETQEPEAEVSFQKKDSTAEPELNEQDKEFIHLLRELQKHFNESEIGQIMEILDAFNADKTQLVPVLELLQEK
jgi:Ca2+-binding EF-hand superfamily protein